MSESHGFVNAGGGRLYFETRGSGHPVVLIHAGIVDRRMWDREFEEFSSQYRVVRYDVRGFGRSDRPKAPYSDSDDLYRLLVHLDIDRVRLVGVSNGGRIIIDFAIEHPAMVEVLVPVASGLGGVAEASNPEEEAAFVALMQRTKVAESAMREGRTEEAIEELLKIWAPAQSPSSLEHVRSLVRDNLASTFADPDFAQPIVPPASTRLSAIRAPTLVLEGERDQPAFHYLADRIVDGIPDSKRRVVQGADHLVNLSQPRAFAEYVLDFLA